MNRRQKIKWGFFFLILVLIPLAGGRGESPMSCHGVSLLVPVGGRAQVLNPTSGITPMGGRDHLYIQNSYLGRPYRGGKAFDWLVDSHTPQTFEVLLEGRLGGKIQKTLSSEPITPHHPNFLLAALAPSEGIVGGDGPTAELVPPDLGPNQFDSREVGSLFPVPAVFPITCPRLASTRYLFGQDSGIDPAVVTDPASDWYEGNLDSKNNPPDDITGGDSAWRWQFDCHNVLCFKKVTTRFDWEDERILIGTDHSGNDVTEAGAGGLYANFHYAVVPCQQTYREQYQQFLNGLPSERRDAISASQLMRCANNRNCTEGYDAYRAMQYLLHLAQGNLAEIGRGEQVPPLRANSVLPGPFLSKSAGNNNGYDQCEWFDTRHHAPVQNMNYHNFCIWDWDSDPTLSEEQCVMVLMWEGDGASTNFARQNAIIGPTDVADDFIGLFEVRRSNTLGAPFVVHNYSNDITLELTTGDATCR